MTSHPRIRLHRSLLASVLACLALGCTSGGPTAPPSPTGAVHLSLPIGGRPYGLSVVRGAAAVTRLDADSVSRVNLASPLTSHGAFPAAGIPTGIAQSPDGSLVIVANQGGSVTLHETATGGRLLMLPMSGSPFRVVAAADGSRAYATSSAGYVLPIDLTARQGGTAVATSLVALNGAALNRNGTSLYVSSMYGDVLALDAHTLATTRRYTLAGQLQDLALSPDESELYVADEGGRVVGLTLSSGTSRQVNVPGAFGLAVTLDGAQLWVTQPMAGTITVLDRATFALIRTLGGDGSVGVPRRIVFDASGAAVVTDEAGYIHVFR